MDAVPKFNGSVVFAFRGSKLGVKMIFKRFYMDAESVKWGLKRNWNRLKAENAVLGTAPPKAWKPAQESLLKPQNLEKAIKQILEAWYQRYQDYLIEESGFREPKIARHQNHYVFLLLLYPRPRFPRYRM